MSYNPSPYGPVAIIPANAMRDNRQLLRSRRNQDIPINAAYYLTPENRSAENRYRSRVVQQQTLERRVAAANHHAPPLGVKTHHRSRSKPSPRNKSPQRVHRTRSYHTSRLYLDQEPLGVHGPVRSYSGPVKYPAPMYSKSRYHAGKGVRTSSHEVYPMDSYPLGLLPSTSRSYMASKEMFTGGEPKRTTYHKYAPTYTTYPPSTLYKQRRDGNYGSQRFKYGTGWRTAMKLMQLVVGACIIGLVIGPTTNLIFHHFIALSHTQGQIAVVTLVAFCLVFTLGLFVTVGLANSSQGWKNADVIFGAIGVLVYLVVGCVEAWYAACYPPIGNVYGIGFACRLPEWIAATVLGFVNLVLYAADLILSFQSGGSVSFS